VPERGPATSFTTSRRSPACRRLQDRGGPNVVEPANVSWVGWTVLARADVQFGTSPRQPASFPRRLNRPAIRERRKRTRRRRGFPDRRPTLGSARERSPSYGTFSKDLREGCADRFQGDARKLLAARQARGGLRAIPARAQAREAVGRLRAPPTGGGRSWSPPRPVGRGGESARGCKKDARIPGLPGDRSRAGAEPKGTNGGRRITRRRKRRTQPASLA
jgi:hypothetical protein